MSSIKYRADIDGLRALAVLAVLVFHTSATSLSGGFVGVDIFFVISGFLITSIIHRELVQENFSFKRFYTRRINRIFPALILILISALTLGWFFLLPVDYSLLGKHIIFGTGFSSNLLLWSESGYFDRLSEAKPLVHLWSLGVEEQFYILWPCFMIFLHRIKKLSWQALLWISIPSFFLCLYLSYVDHNSAFYLPFTRFWELGAGGALALYGVTNNKDKFWSSLGLILLLAAILKFNGRFIFPGWIALIPVAGTVFILWSGPLSLINQKFFSFPLLRQIGLISYPLYLWHQVFLAIIELNSFRFSENKLIFIKIFVILLCFPLSFLTYKFVEMPVRKNNNGKTAKKLFSTLLVIGILGGVTYFCQGFPSRYPTEVLQWLKPIPFEFEENARFGVCHFDSRSKNNHATVGSSECVESRSPLLVLWGDSYAAALYPGLKSLQESKKFGIVQATQCGTPPFLQIDFDNSCVNRFQMNRWNNAVLQLISEKKPNFLLLESFWNVALRSELIEQLTKTVKKVKSLSPKTEIFILGPVPKWGGWEDGLPRYLYRYWTTHSHQPVPIYMSYGLDERVRTQDEFLAKEIPKLGAKYLSAIKVMCSEQGCLTRIGSQSTDITAIDLGHLSPAGSRFLIKALAPEIFDSY